ncbi:hypothetical protein OUZ56_017663 [Daphnia magna]|uniref:Uncharacterized protein n=1 Tax=Daphnia magna TaxID=35525 RepID=A0ABR0ATC9_9CRUS|nr:hypothetical protein OUZ56_017663 [Daphnia magna]
MMKMRERLKSCWQSCSDRFEDRDRLIDRALFRDRERDHRSRRKERIEIEIEGAGIENQFARAATYESKSALIFFGSGTVFPSRPLGGEPSRPLKKRPAVGRDTWSRREVGGPIRRIWCQSENSSARFPWLRRRGTPC